MRAFHWPSLRIYGPRYGKTETERWTHVIAKLINCAVGKLFPKLIYPGLGEYSGRISCTTWQILMASWSEYLPLFSSENSVGDTFGPRVTLPNLGWMVLQKKQNYWIGLFPDHSLKNFTTDGKFGWSLKVGKLAVGCWKQGPAQVRLIFIIQVIHLCLVGHLLLDVHCCL